MIQPVVTHFDPFYIRSFALHADAIVASTVLQVGDLLRYESAGLGIFDTVSEDTTFIGVSAGKTTTTMVATDLVPVYLKCIVDIDLTSANYNCGDGLIYTSKNTLVDDSGSNTIAWFFGKDLDTIVRGSVLIDVPLLGASAAKLFTAED